MAERSEPVAPEERPAHRFSFLPYSPQDPMHAVLVVVCDCGWADITGNRIGSGLDAALLYVEHIGRQLQDGAT